MRHLTSLKLHEFLEIYRNVRGLKNKAEAIRSIQAEFERSIGPDAVPSDRAIQEWFSEKKLSTPPRKLTVEILTNLFIDNDPDAFFPRIIKELQLLDIDTESIRDWQMEEVIFQMARIVLGKDTDSEDIRIYFSNSTANELKDSSPYLTRLPVYTDRHNFLFHEEEIGYIIDTVHSSRIPILICGMGGIGKTALARFLFYKLENDYDLVGWITNLGGLENSLLAYVDLFQEIDSHRERANKIKEFLRDNPKKKLLVIDDVNEAVFEDPLLYQMASWRNLTLIVTSRVEEADGFLSVPVKEFTDEESRSYFNHYYDLNKHDDEQMVVDKIVRYAGNHPLTLELIAKGAKYKTDLYSFYQKIETMGLNAINRPLSSAQHKSLMAEEHLRALYDVSTLSQEEKRVLHNLAKFPSVDLPIGVVEWINASESTVDKLAYLGWISFHNKGYYIHPIIKQIVNMDECSPDEFDAMMKTIISRSELSSLYCRENSKELNDSKLNLVIHFIHSIDYDACEKIRGWMNIICFFSSDNDYLEEQINQMVEFYEKQGIQDAEIDFSLLYLQVTAAMNLRKYDIVEKKIPLMEEYLTSAPEIKFEDLSAVFVIVISLYTLTNETEKCERYVEKLDRIVQKHNPSTFLDYTAYIQAVNMLSKFYTHHGLWDSAESVINLVLEKEWPLELKRTTIYGTFCHNTAKFYTDRQPWKEENDHLAIGYELEALAVYKLSCDDDHLYCVTSEKRIRKYHSKYFPDTNYEEWYQANKPF